jgi:hypothetical protein
VVCCALLLSGCAIINEGSVDYRKTKIAPVSSKSAVPRVIGLEEKNVYPSDALTVIDHTKGDTVSVFLQTGFIKDFVEFPALISKGEFIPRGEMAIIVNVFELGEGKDFSYAPGDFQKGRVIFFSDDVRKGQFLNFNYLPIYGPKPYTGKTLGIEITIMELDSESKALKSLLGVLAGVGAIAYPASSPVLALLNKLGGAMLSGSHDDRLFKYYMTLNPAGGNQAVKYPILAEGHYVFLRKEDRRAPEDWKYLALNQDDGTLVVQSRRTPRAEHGAEWEKRLEAAQAQDGKYREETYLVFQVRRNMPVNDYDLQVHNGYEDFRTKFEAAQTAGKMGEIERVVKEFATGATSAKVYERLRAAFLMAVHMPAEQQAARNAAFEQLVLNINRAAGCLRTAQAASKEVVLTTGCLNEQDLEKLCLVMQNYVPDMENKKKIEKGNFLATGMEQEVVNALKQIPATPSPVKAGTDRPEPGGN